MESPTSAISSYLSTPSIPKMHRTRHTIHVQLAIDVIVRACSLSLSVRVRRDPAADRRTPAAATTSAGVTRSGVMSSSKNQGRGCLDHHQIDTRWLAAGRLAQNSTFRTAAGGQPCWESRKGPI